MKLKIKFTFEVRFLKPKNFTMILPIVAYGDSVLRKVAHEVTAEYFKDNPIVQNMFDTMYKAHGVGLAAPQVGLDIRLFVVDVSPFADDEDLPKQAQDLMNSVRIKWKATAMGIERLMMKQGKMIGYFIGDQQSDFYQSNRFMKVLQFAQRNGNVCKIKEKETKNGLRLLLTFDNVKSVNKALELLEGI